MCTSIALDAKLGDGAAEIDGVPEGDGGDREVETGGSPPSPRLLLLIVQRVGRGSSITP
jgi:hypothetical protein